MGYYSDVAVCMYKKDYMDMLKHFKEKSPDAYGTWTTADYKIFRNRKDESNPIVTAVIYMTKWYKEFEDVIYTEKYLDYCDEADIPYQYIRIGEESGDEDERYSGSGVLWEYCNIARKIDWGFDPIKTGDYAGVIAEPDSVNVDEII